MVYAVILAGGIGSRMKSSTLPKQFLTLGNEPILRLTIDKVLFCPKIDHIIVAAPAVWMSHTKDLLKDAKYDDVQVCEGGKTRQESLFFAVKHIEKVYSVADDDIVVSHDVARPFVSLRIIEENIKMLDTYDAADTVIPATDTIVESLDSRVISKIPDRVHMYQGQTPQTFRRIQYLDIYSKLESDYLSRMSDAARILAEHGCTVGLVMGDNFNIKITNEFDFRIANFLVEQSHD